MADTYAPGNMTVAADGSVLFDFAGHVHAQGLDLDAGTTTTPPDDDRIRWLRASDGALVADDTAYDAAGSRERTSRAVGDAVTAARATLLAEGPGGEARLTALAQPGGLLSVDAQAQGGGLRTLIDSANASSFPTLYDGGLPAAADRRYASGVAVVTWPGGSAQSDLAAGIAHGLGATPGQILLGPAGDLNAFFVPVYSTLNYGAATFDMRGYTITPPPGAGTAAAVAWLAIA